jgi:uncharacterized protein
MGSPFKSRGFAALAALGISVALLLPAQAQFWDWGNRPQRQQQRDYNPFGGWFSPRWDRDRDRDRGERSEREAPVDYSHAPGPAQKKAEANTPIVVMGDSFADWLAYGLEDAFSENPDIAIVRKQRADSGLIRYGGRGESEWPQVARETIAAEKPKIIVMMIGNNDRQLIREKAPAVVRAGTAKPNAQPATTPAPPPVDPEQQPPEQPEAAQQPPPANLSPGEARQAAYGPWEFHSEKWELAYIKRIDATIAALKSAGVPVLWVGLPSQRGTRASTDSSYLNDLYRSRAEKAGITYVDIWDGFVDEAGHYSPQGPDYEGQIRRLRTNDGVYFTKYGARKLAHYVEREIERSITNRGVPVALPTPVAPGPQGAPGAAPGGAAQRPVAGPVLPLTTTATSAAPEELLGGARPARAATTDAVAARVLTKGEPIAAPSGRADDFRWPRGSGAADAAPVEPGGMPSATPAALPPSDAQGSQGATGQPNANQPNANQASNTDLPDAPTQPKRRVQRRVQRNTPDILRPLLSIPNLFR